MIITITLDQRHIDEALETLAEHEPAIAERSERQAEAIEAICAAIQKNKDKAEAKRLKAKCEILNRILRNTYRDDVVSDEERALCGQIADVMVKIQDLES